jgi:hypothetical protein
MNMAEFGFRYNFSFAQTGFSTRHSGNSTTLVEYARGSIINDRYNRYIKADNKANIGRGGIIVKAFLDYNANGKRDMGEPSAPGLNLRANGGRVDRSENDTIISILGLEPYTSCYIELDPNSFDNIAWTLAYESISVEVDPNVIKTVSIPVRVLGEASGFVRIQNDDEDPRGLGRVIVNFFKADGTKVVSTLSEQDGYYGYFGFVPGSYYVMPDTAQLRRLGMACSPDSINFNISAEIEGDLIRGLDFLLGKLEISDSTSLDTSLISPEPPAEPVIRRDTSYMIVHEMVEELMTITEDSWAIQLGAFTVKANAERLKDRLEGLLGKEAEIVVEGGFHKVRILEIKDRAEVDEHLAVLNKNGFNEFWVIQLKAMQQQLVLREVDDTLTTILETVIDPDSPEAAAKLSIKIGAFMNENMAVGLKDKLSITLDNELQVIKEDNYHKILITGFESITEFERTISSLGIQGIRNLDFAPGIKPEPVIPADSIKVADTLQALDTIPAMQERIAADSLGRQEALMQEKEIETGLQKESLKMEEPKISLLVGNFSRRTQAQKAKRTIESKLNLPVTITEQWDMYRVVVTGFFTVEETYPYYPELAGIGYNVMYIIDESGK